MQFKLELFIVNILHTSDSHGTNDKFTTHSWAPFDEALSLTIGWLLGHTKDRWPEPNYS